MGVKSVALLGRRSGRRPSSVEGRTVEQHGARSAVPSPRLRLAPQYPPQARRRQPSPAVEAEAPRATALETAPPAVAQPAAPSPRLSRAHGPRTGGAWTLQRNRAAPALLTAESSLALAARAEVRHGRCDGALEPLREGDDRFPGAQLVADKEPRLSTKAASAIYGIMEDVDGLENESLPGVLASVSIPLSTDSA